LIGVPEAAVPGVVVGAAVPGAAVPPLGADVVVVFVVQAAAAARTMAHIATARSAPRARDACIVPLRRRG
jgi:hypothetical protein